MLQHKICDNMGFRWPVFSGIVCFYTGEDESVKTRIFAYFILWVVHEIFSYEDDMKIKRQELLYFQQALETYRLFFKLLLYKNRYSLKITVKSITLKVFRSVHLIKKKKEVSIRKWEAVTQKVTFLKTCESAYQFQKCSFFARFWLCTKWMIPKETDWIFKTILTWFIAHDLHQKELFYYVWLHWVV